MNRMRLWPNSSVFILLCCLVLLLGGCGKKGPPKPPIKKTLPKVKNLKAVVVDAGVNLTWTMDSSDEEAAGFTVYRSKAQPEIYNCPGCQREFEIITTIRVKRGKTRFEVVDPDVEGKGEFYYKVTPFDKKDRPGPDSNESRVLIE
jgi:predicted small lipoprotein YifL